MLEVDVDVVKGIMFIRLEGVLNENTFHDFAQELNYLLYKQGMHFFVFNFGELRSIEQGIFSSFQNKLIEIFLNCGKVVMCGLNDLFKKDLGTREELFFVNSEREAFKYLTI